MANKKFFNRITALALTFVAAVFAAVAVNAVRFAEAAERSQYYKDNKTLVACIDDGAEYFALLDEAEETEQMRAIVKVAQAIVDLEDGFDPDDYLPDDADALQKVFRLCENYCKVKGETTDGDNYYLDYASFVDRNLAEIANLATRAEAVPTMQDRFDGVVATDKAFIDQKLFNKLTETRIHANGKANAVLDFYDEAAVAEMNAVAESGKAALDALTLDKADYNASIAAAEAAKQACSEKLDRVNKNDIERAYSAVNDYYAAEFENSEDLSEVEAAAKIAVEKGYAFLSDATDEIKNRYIVEKQALDRFSAKDDGKGQGENVKKSSLTSENGVVTVTAMADGVEVPVFPTNANVRIADNSGSIYKLNAENEIIAIDGSISVAYCFDVTVYNGVSEWKVVTEFEGKPVVYKVAVDLAKYYKECVENRTSWLGEKLADKGFGKEDRDDHLNAIKECVEYLNSNDTGASLCYQYLGRSNVEALGWSVEGDTVIFETKSFSNFTVMKAGGRSVFTSPVFWFIFLLAIVIAFVVVVIVMSNIKYKIEFCTNGGSTVDPVTAKKDEYFIMPKNPVKRGFTFGGWFEDKDLTVRFVDTCMLKRRSFKVYAKWNAALTQEQADEYFVKLRDMLASHAAIGDSFEIEKGAKIRLAKVVDDELEVKLYLALNPENVLKDRSVNVRAVVGEKYADTPLLKTVDSAENYEEAVELIGLLCEQYALKQTEPVIEDESAKTYVLELCGECCCEEKAEESVEDPIEEPVEETVEEQAEEGVEAPTEEQLADYYRQIRTFTKGFALAEDNAALDKDATLVRTILKDDCVEVYLKADAEKIGAEKAEGALAEETPALLKVCCEETLENAKSAIKTVLTELGLEESGEQVDLGDSQAKAFGYKLKFED